MAVWTWIGWVALALAIAVFVLVKVIGAVLSAVFRLLGAVAVAWLAFGALDEVFACEDP